MVDCTHDGFDFNTISRKYLNFPARAKLRAALSSITQHARVESVEQNCISVISEYFNKCEMNPEV